MRARTAIAGTRPGGRLTAAGCAALAILATTTACSTPSGAAAAGSTSGTATGSPSSGIVAPGPNSSARHTPSASSSPSSPPTPAPPTTSASATQSASPVPVGPPSTGGGGTAGVQDILLFGLGGAALLAGAGSLVYRRRTLRDR